MLDFNMLNIASAETLLELTELLQTAIQLAKEMKLRSVVAYMLIPYIPQANKLL
jgi:hypothetical protein